MPLARGRLDACSRLSRRARLATPVPTLGSPDQELSRQRKRAAPTYRSGLGTTRASHGPPCVHRWRGRRLGECRLWSFRFLDAPEQRAARAGGGSLAGIGRVEGSRALTREHRCVGPVERTRRLRRISCPIAAVPWRHWTSLER